MATMKKRGRPPKVMKGDLAKLDQIDLALALRHSRPKTSSLQAYCQWAMDVRAIATVLEHYYPEFDWDGWCKNVGMDGC